MRLALLLAAFSMAAAQPPAPKAVQKKLIEFGWDEPDPFFMKRHAASMRQRPFDGTIFHINYTREDGKTGNFSWEGWGKKQFREADLEPSIQPLLDADLGSLRHNFPRFNVTPANLDWFDDHSAILENARLAAWFAKRTNCPGISFEVEQYNGQLFNYPKQRDAGVKSWEAYSAQARLRGREVMQAFQKGYPGLTVFLSLGYSYPWKQINRGGTPLRDASYGLLAPFLDGLVEAAEGNTRIVDGHESAYSYLTPEQFTSGYRLMKSEVLPIVADPAKYARLFGFSFGIWMDRNSNRNGWSADDFSKNGHSPENLERIVTKALQTADEYVWLYSERLKWWTDPNGASEKVPAVYEDAVRRARAAAQAPLQAPPPAAASQPYPRISEAEFRARLPFFAHSPGVPLEARAVSRSERGESVREKIVFRGAQGFLVPGFLEMPKQAVRPLPLVLLLHGWSGSKDVWWDDAGIHNGGLMRKALLGAGYAILALDAATHGERASEIDYLGVIPFIDPRAPVRNNYFSFAEITVQTVKDYQRALDYLAQRGDIDMNRIGLVGYSMGGMDSFYLLSVEPRIKAAVACVPPLYSPGYGPASPIDYSWGVRDKALLLLMGRKDTMYDFDRVNASFDQYMRSPSTQIIWYDQGHGLTGVYVPDALQWIQRRLPPPVPK
ncbi:MAG: alpha/beta fold hydrolase [Acidobacteria bacterium]|nr:alpha/beta fold hydrolase [Acidobacteriota bacterium]